MSRRLINLLNQSFDHWTVFARGENNVYGHPQWWCRCDCPAQTERLILASTLKRSPAGHCGCQPDIRFQDLTGKQFTYWRVIEFVEQRGSAQYWLCECSCPDKTRAIRSTGYLNSHPDANCGCFRREKQEARRQRLEAHRAARTEAIQRGLIPLPEYPSLIQQGYHPLTLKDLAWLAGLLEGEAAFMFHGKSATIELQMVDADVVQRAAFVMHTMPRKPWLRKDGYQVVFSCVVTGTRAICWMMTLYSFMGKRRRAKITEILLAWRASKGMPRAPRGQRFDAICHPGRPRAGNGLCQTCYMQRWRKHNHHENSESIAQELDLSN